MVEPTGGERPLTWPAGGECVIWTGTRPTELLVAVTRGRAGARATTAPPSRGRTPTAIRSVPASRPRRAPGCRGPARRPPARGACLRAPSGFPCCGAARRLVRPVRGGAGPRPGVPRRVRGRDQHGPRPRPARAAGGLPGAPRALEDRQHGRGDDRRWGLDGGGVRRAGRHRVV